MTCTHRSLVRSVTTWVVALLILFAPPLIEQAYADREQAARHYQAGRDLYSSGDYQGAIREFETANRLAPSPILDFNIGLARERMGQIELAVQHYRAYITAMPNATNRAAVDAKIQTLESELAAKRANSPTAPAVDPGIGGRRPQPGTGSTTDPAAGTATVTDPAAKTESPFGAVNEAKAAEPATSESDSGADNRVRDLRRVAQVNIADVRDRRARAMLDRPAMPTTPVAQNSHADFGKKKKAKPAYKKWWFWAIVGVSAYILLDLATGDDGNSRDVPDFPLNGGPVLLRF